MYKQKMPQETDPGEEKTATQKPKSLGLLTVLSLSVRFSYMSLLI